MLASLCAEKIYKAAVLYPVLMQEEFIDVIDDLNRVVGRAPKSVVHAEGKRHRVSAVLLMRADGSYLIPTASGIKAESGRLYHSAAGHVTAGESYRDAALRELREETGIIASRLDFLGSFWFEKEYPSRTELERFEVYIAPYSGEGRIRLNDEQMDERWLTRDALLVLWRETPERVSCPLQMTCTLLAGVRG